MQEEEVEKRKRERRGTGGGEEAERVEEGRVLQNLKFLQLSFFWQK